MGLHKVVKSIHEEPLLHYPCFPSLSGAPAPSPQILFITPNLCNPVRNVILSIPYTSPIFSSSLVVAHALSAKTPSEKRILIWAREGGKEKNCTEAAPDLEEPRFPWSQHDCCSTAPLLKLSIPVSESQARAGVPGDTYVTLAGPGQPGGERRPPSSPTIPHRRRCGWLRLPSWVKSDLPRLSAQALPGKKRGRSETGWSLTEKGAGKGAGDWRKGTWRRRGRREIKRKECWGRSLRLRRGP